MSVHRYVLVVGPTRVGKTFVACALAQAAIRRCHTALYLRIIKTLVAPYARPAPARTHRCRRVDPVGQIREEV